MGGMKDTLGETIIAFRDPRQLVRTADPGTSREAARKIVGRLNELQKKVLAEYHRAGSDGLCDFDLQSRLGDHGSTYRTRRAELVSAGLLADSGRTVVREGRKRIVWITTTKGDDYASR